MWHRRGLLLGLLLLGAHASAEPATRAAPLDELMRRLAAIRESRASFVEDKTVAALAAPVHSRGWLAYRRPNYLEKTTTSPVTESLLVDGDRLSLTLQGHQPRTIDLGEEPALAALVEAIRGTLSGDLPALRRSYAVAMAGSADSWRLTLAPTARPLTNLLGQVVIDGEGPTLRRVDITQANGDRSVMTIGAPDPPAR